MKLIEKLKNKLRKKLAAFIIPELNKKEDKKDFRFKKFGSDSYLWGSGHYISGADYIEIGKNVHINSNCYIRGEGGIEIGDNTHISRNLTMYSINHDYKGNALPYDNRMVKKKVVIGKNVWIGMNVCIVPGTSIGDGCIIGMGTTVSGTVPPLSIIGSPKFVILGQRDKDHYDHLEKLEMYGAADGILYKKSENELLESTGDIYNSRRSKSELIEHNGKKAVRKTYLNTDDGRESHKNELLAYSVFKNYSWCPEIYAQDENSVIIEYFPAIARLDKISNPSEQIAEEILWSLLDIFNEGYVHRDFHARNIFVTEEGIKIIDFETIAKTDEKNFFNSYDITGKGMESPYLTDNMCILNKSQTSIGGIFSIKDEDQIRTLLNRRFKKQMLDSSISFKTLRNSAGRHNLQTKNIYSSFDLKNISVSPDESQRDTAARLKRFGIEANEIRGKKILDIGSNIGGTLCALIKYEPYKMLGLEYDADKVALSNKLSKYNEADNLNFKCADIEDENFKNGFDEKFDIVFCLAVIEHLKAKEKLFSFLDKVTASTLYFEGNANTDIDSIIDGLKNAGFSQVKYLGLSDDEKNSLNNVRPLFVAYK